jgi:hypothetical protein
MRVHQQALAGRAELRVLAPAVLDRRTVASTYDRGLYT